MFYLQKGAVKHEGVQIFKLLINNLCNCKHIVCKMLHIILLLDVSMTLINNLHLGIYIAKVKDHDFYR